MISHLSSGMTLRIPPEQARLGDLPGTFKAQTSLKQMLAPRSSRLDMAIGIL